MKKPSKFLAPAVLQEAAEQVASLAKNQAVLAALLGDYAMQLYGSDRLTGDLAFASESWILGLKRGKELTFGGAQTTADNGVPVDIILRDDDDEALYTEAVNLATRIPESGIRLVRPEHLAAIKMAARRPKDDLDLDFLILEPGLLDVTKTKQIVRRFLGSYALQEFQARVDEALWRASRA